jgi:hypothetical protein
MRELHYMNVWVLYGDTARHYVVEWLRTCKPSADASSKDDTSSSWPSRSIIAEWIGIAYMSGSYPRLDK